MEMSNSVDRFTNVLKKFTGRNEKYGTMDEFMNDLCGVWSQLTKDERDTVSKTLMGKKLNNNRVDDLLRDINNGFNSSPMKKDKKNIENLVSVTEDMLKQCAVDKINNKPKDTSHYEHLTMTPKELAEALTDKLSIDEKIQYLKDLEKEIEKEYEEQMKIMKEAKEPTIMLSAKVGKVILTCKQCGYDMTNKLSDEYRAKAGFDGKRYLDKTPTIHKDLVSDVVCEKCGCNLVDATISIEVDNPLTQK